MNIKLLIAYHKESVLFKDDILTPINVGRALLTKDNKSYDWLYENMIGDDTGDNISVKNPSYNELTALYWAWKNYDSLGNPDYIGLMHYRRHLIFDEEDKSIVKKVSLVGKESYLESIKYSRENIESILAKGDFVYNQGHVSNIYDQYKLHHRIEDLELVIDILKNKYPEYSSDADAYLKESYGCFANMFIFPKEMFFEYCAWLFDIIAEFEKQVDLTNRRLFISERLTGIFVYHKLKKGLKGIPLSSTFINEPLRTDVCIKVNKDNIFQTAVLLNSIINQNNYPFINIVCHILYDDESIDTKSLDYFDKSILSVEWCKLDRKIDDEKLPFLLGVLFPEVGKMLYLDVNTLVFASIDIIWEACNTFEFMCLYSSSTTKNKVYCFNLKLMRLYNIAKLADEHDNPFEQLLLKYPEQCKVMAPWVMFNVTVEEDSYGLYEKKRMDIENENKVWTKCMFHYESGLEPWNNLRCCYSIYWWDKAESLPYSIPFPKLDVNALVKQVEEMNDDVLTEIENIRKADEEKATSTKPKRNILIRVLKRIKRSIFKGRK